MHSYYAAKNQRQMTTTTITVQLTAITGPQYVRASQDTIHVTPANTQQISEILRHANENHLTVTPIGGNTKQTWGNPVQAQIHLELHRLNRVLEHPWQDLTCTVQAGCTWQHLQETLAQRGQFVALDPLFPHRATVGGILATNDSGALRHKYGSLRDLVIGMTLVLPEGTIARSGGRVVKNVAGYDLCKLLTGSLGTLAVITEATFRLHPLPQHAQTFTVSAPQAAQLAPLMATIRASHLLTQALQLRGDTSGFHLDIQLNAHPEAHQDDILNKMTESAGLKLDEPIGQKSQHTPAEPLAPASQIAPRRDDRGSSGLQAAELNPATKVGFNPGSLPSAWAALESLFANEGAFIVKIGMLPTDVPHIADDIVHLGGSVVAQSLGVIYAAFPNIKRDYSPLGSLYAYTDTGSMTLLQIPSSPHDDPTPPWGPDKPNPLMQAIKHQFDPNQTLNPGRFLGGI
jgi:glycolate oxidase FAD binding subunit